jgi:CubicO group peptidase (beta-lactamase class C family)
MSLKRFLFPLLLACTVLALTLRRFVKPFSAGAVSDSTSYDAIDTYVEQQMHRLNIPGLSMAIVEGDRIVHLRGFGHARPGGGPPSPDTPFVLGSTTKSFTALAIMQLVEAGKVDLDVPAQRYLPWFRVADPQASARMTVRHLLNQTSGLPMFEGTIVLADLDPSPSAAERHARALSSLALNHPVGAKFEYSNLNFILAGLIVEAASGEAYPDYIQNHIFNPLEMRHSYTSQAQAKQKGLTIGHRYWFAHPVAAPDIPVSSATLAAGQLISCAQDMAHYLIAHLNGGRYGKAQILSSEGIDELHRPGVEFREMGASMGYGMGWFVENIGPVKVVSHSGNVPDFSSYMALIPEQKRNVRTCGNAIVLLLNADNYGLPPVLAEVGLGATAVLAGQQAAPIRLGLIPWAMRALLVIPLAQIIGIMGTLLALRRWQRHRERRPSGARLWVQYILLPLIPNLSLAALPVVLKAKGLLQYLKLYNPDIFWTAIICGGLSAVWTFLRTGLIVRVLRER